MYTITNFDKITSDLKIGLVKYILNVPLEYSPDTISEATIVDKKGIWLIKTAMIIYEEKYPFIKLPKNIKESWSCP
tara:strand:- start:379 stop:606 length:228 start_codon:yes stop_codon:yes gene_type:complete